MSVPPLNPGLFHLDADHLWVQHCSEGPVPRAVARSVRAWLQKELGPWEMDWAADFLGIPQELRVQAARLVGGDTADISLSPCTSAGLVTLAQGWSWERGDEILAPLGEFPSNIWPWKALAPRGVAFRELPLWAGHRAGAKAWEGLPPTAAADPEERLLAQLGPRTRFLVLSWVRFQDGLKLDLRRLGEGCRRKGVHLIVDGIQGAGTHLPDLSRADAFACGGHKGLLGPQGQGFLWTAPDFRKRLMPTGTWLSVEEATEFTRPSTDHQRDWVEDGRRLEPGSPSIMACAALLESLKVINEAGPEAIAAHVQALQLRLLDALDGGAGAGSWAAESRRLRELLEAGRLGPILALHHDGRGFQGLQALLEKGARRGILASVREGYLRIAFHGWHGDVDVDRVAHWLSEG